MQRGNALKAVRQDTSEVRRAAEEATDGAQQPLLSEQDSRSRWRRAGHAVSASMHLRRTAQETAYDRDRSNPADSFYKTTLSLMGSVPGTGLRPSNSSNGGARGRPPAFWSPRSDLRALWGLLVSSWINVALVLVPLGYVAYKLEWNAVAVFCLNFCGIIPLALILGDVTEDLALRSGEVIGGLVNATFGNVVELILSCVALSKKQPALNNVAGLSNLGSILSNLLLVLGCCFFFGGMFHYVQSFNAVANQVCNSLLFLAVVGLTLPVAAANLAEIRFSAGQMLMFSRIIAVLLLLTYVTYLYFQLMSHSDLFKADKTQEIPAPRSQQNRLDQMNPARDVESGSGGGGQSGNQSGGQRTNGGSGETRGEGDGDGDDDEQEQPVLTITAELLTLLAISVIVAMASEFITDSIEDMAASSGLTTSFLSVVLLPLAGNAVEHITAVMVAMKNKMDLALGIALGSSIQIAIFVLPTCVLFSWAIGNPFTLQLDGLGTVALAVAITHANFITAGGRSHYLMGVQLICTYLLISSAFLFTRNDS